MVNKGWLICARNRNCYGMEQGRVRSMKRQEHPKRNYEECIGCLALVYLTSTVPMNYIYRK